MAIKIYTREEILAERATQEKKRQEELFLRQRAALLPSPAPKSIQQSKTPLPIPQAKGEPYVPDLWKNLHKDIRQTDKDVRQKPLMPLPLPYNVPNLKPLNAPSEIKPTKNYVGKDAFSSAKDKFYKEMSKGKKEVNYSLDPRLPQLRAEETKRLEGYNSLVNGAIKIDNFRKSDKELLSGKTAQNNLGKSLTYGMANVAQGILGVSEGVQKFTGALAGKIVRLDEFSEAALNLNNAENFRKLVDEDLKPSETQKNVGKFVEAGSAMLPSVAANVALPGAGLALIGASAAGNSASEGYKKSGNIDNAILYGTLSGIIEIATEKLFNGIPMLQNSGIVSNVINKITQTLNRNPKVKNALASVIDVLGEGAEEAISTFIDPYLQRATVDKNATPATSTEVMQSAIMGGLLSLVMNSGFKAADLLSNGKKPDVQRPYLNTPDKFYAKDLSVNSNIPPAGTKLNKSLYEFVPPNATSINDLTDSKTYKPNQIPIPRLSGDKLAKLNEDIAKIKAMKVIPSDAVLPIPQTVKKQNALPKELIPGLQETTPSQAQIDNYIDKAINSQNTNYMFKIKNVSGDEAKYIFDKTGVNVNGYKHILTDNDIRHILNQHGNVEIETKRGQIAVTPEDIKKIPQIIEGFDDVGLGTEKNGRKSIKYAKVFEDGNVYYVETVNDAKNTLNTKTMWKKPVKGVGSADAHSESAPYIERPKTPTDNVGSADAHSESAPYIERPKTPTDNVGSADARLESAPRNTSVTAADNNSILLNNDDVNMQSLYDTAPSARNNGIIETGTDGDYAPITIPNITPKQSNFAEKAEQVSNTLKKPLGFLSRGTFLRWGKWGQKCTC